VLSNIISSQNFHTLYGGIVPELASRSHTEVISQIVNKALENAETEINEIDAIAVTTSPGLVGSLLVGSNFAKGLAIKYNLPIVPINHIEGHIFSGNLQESDVEFPIISLVVSGGHTALFLVRSYLDYELIGSTVDDAAGEAFDKIAKMLGLGYPGGPLVDRLAKEGNASAYKFPRSMLNQNNFNFSFSGLKTSVRYFLQKEFPGGVPENVLPDICASAQEAIAEVLSIKTVKSARIHNCKTIVIGGGVSANSRLRQMLGEKAEKIHTRVILPNMEYCIDNAAMIGFVAGKKLDASGTENFTNLTFTANPNAIRA
jgi:tRNA N6-adenosine threonylcarbamoyltransferase